ncbi:family 10 glycosylhydrolase [Cyanobium sp. Alchichica 3B3-8F6]|uniref:glycoside hydrolase family 10 protein n=1 Tax=Synechococcales TaxID=1890424 RepID=UPI0018E9805E|nr:family 10 glycosylhydrolase [Cyanobium sp. Alchichica 3B3-8F6]
MCRFARFKALLPAAVSVLLTVPWAAAQPLQAQPLQIPQRRIGVWLTNSPSPLYYDPSRIDRAVSELANAGFNTLYPNVWSRGTTFHRSRHAPLEPALEKASPNLDPICRFTRAAHRRGLQVIPWFEYGLMEPADAAVVRQHPEWVLQRRDGSSEMAMHGKPMVWLNPAHPGVRERFIGLITEIVQRCSVDGIQLDDHFAWPVELGYDPFSRALFLKDTGREPPDNHTDRAWMRWRRQQLTGLLRELRGRLKTLEAPAGSVPKRTIISLSPGPFRFAYNHWLQDWELWALGELIDDLVVQNYAYSVKGFEKDLNQPALVKARSWGMPVEIGILAGFGGRTPDMATLAQKTQLATSRGHGVIYFYWEGLWGLHAGAEGATYRQAAFRQLHQSLNGPLRPPPPLPLPGQRR